MPLNIHIDYLAFLAQENPESAQHTRAACCVAFVRLVVAVVSKITQPCVRYTGALVSAEKMCSLWTASNVDHHCIIG